MINQELKDKLGAEFPDAVFEDGSWLNVSIDSSLWLAMAIELRNRKEFSFDYLFCVTGVDWKTHFSVVYHLNSTKHNHSIVIKAKISERIKPSIETVSHIWRTAELHERETYDLFGIIFLHHPDLRRLFLTDDWEGWPLRKDYVDEINMIKL
jgi:NADH-quinone oxidoreductase subunit C